MSPPNGGTLDWSGRLVIVLTGVRAIVGAVLTGVRAIVGAVAGTGLTPELQAARHKRSDAESQIARPKPAVCLISVSALRVGIPVKRSGLPTHHLGA